MGQPGCKLEVPAVYCPGSGGEGGEIWVFAEAYAEQRMRLLVYGGEAWRDKSAALVMPKAKGCCHGSVCAISETMLAGLYIFWFDCSNAGLVAVLFHLSIVQGKPKLDVMLVKEIRICVSNTYNFLQENL